MGAEVGAEVVGGAGDAVVESAEVGAEVVADAGAAVPDGGGAEVGTGVLESAEVGAEAVTDASAAVTDVGGAQVGAGVGADIGEGEIAADASGVTAAAGLPRSRSRMLCLDSSGPTSNPF